MIRTLLRWTLPLALVVATACAGGDGTTAPRGDTPTTPPAEPQVPGALSLSASGLPSGSVADLLVTGPGGFSRTASGVAAWTDLVPGRYTVSARPVRTTEGTYAVTPTVREIDVAAGGVPSVVSLSYTPLPSVVQVELTGLPASTAGAIAVTTPDGRDTTITTSAQLSSAQRGRWQLRADSVRAAGARFAPTPAAVDSTLLYGDTLRVPVRYDIASGALAVAVTGLPTGVDGAVTVRGPDGFSSAVTATRTLTELVPGDYRVIVAPVTSAALTYAPAADTLLVTVSASLTATAATVSYHAQVGRLTIAITGLPDGSSAPLQLTGTGAVAGISRPLSGAGTTDSLPAGSYSLSAAPVTAGSVRYVPASPTYAVNIAAGETANLTISYGPQPTVVDLTVNGLPGGTNASVTLTSPSGQTSAITASTRISPAASGRWQLAASPVTTSTARYVPSPSTRDTTVSAGDTLHLPVQYTLATGSLALVVSGLPGVTDGQVTVTGPDGYTRTVTETTTFLLLTPGVYTVTASNVTISGTQYTPTPATQQVTVSASAVAAPASVSYAPLSGSINITTSGLPGGVAPSFTLTKGGAVQSANSAGVVSGLVVGTWTVDAATITSGGTIYTPSPTSLPVTVVANSTTVAGFSYTGTPTGPDYSITNVYLTQATQKLDGSVSLVAGRDALLRVFVRANAANSARPDVRVRIYDGATLLQTTTITAPEASVRTSIDEGTLGSTWNLLVSAANIRPALRILAELDPTQAVPDADRTNNSWPAGGTPQTVSVVSTPAFVVRFVPVTVGSKTGNVTAGNMNSFLTTLRRVWPIATVTADVRAPFTSSADTLVSNDSNSRWLTVLSEMNTLRSTDGAPSTMHYYGVVKVGYSSGIAGYGYVPGRAAVGWDYLPSGDGVAAHEWGHNFSRPHAPCGGVAGPDPSFPYAGGTIGAYGWNSATNALVSPTTTDLMGYCNPTWVSDYNWTKVMTYRQSSGYEVAAGATGEGLLVWGRVVNGAVVLEPAFRVTAPISRAAAQPTHRVEALDANGDVLLDLPITADAVDHASSRDERQFSVVLPWSASLEASLAGLRVRDVRLPLRAAQRTSPSAVRAAGEASAARVPGQNPGAAPRTLQLPDPQDAVTIASAGRVRVRWNQQQYPMAMVRDAATGQVMGYVRQSGAEIVGTGRPVDVVYSDGVRSVVRRALR